LDFFGQQNLVLENETNCLRDKTQQMIDRLDEASRALEGEKHRVGELNKLQVKLIACR
jgi:uncharacterized iron-regulated protein